MRSTLPAAQLAMRALLVATLSFLLATAAAGQTGAGLEYTLSVDSARLDGYQVEIRFRSDADTVRLAMPAHPEYDQRFWRQLRDLRVEGHGPIQIVRTDSAVWRIVGGGPERTVRYRIELPPPEGEIRPSWVPFLAANGGLVAGPYSFLYPLGGEGQPARLTLRLPAGWSAVSGLEPGASPHTFVAPDFATLNDGPVLVGQLQRWSFGEGGVEHQVAWLSRPGAAAPDSAALLGAVRGIVHQSRLLFGGFPYRRFAFLLQDGAYGGLEHASSTTIGGTAQELAGDRADFLLSLAHEYVHSWNLVQLRPAGWGGLSVQPRPRTRELWWSEGVTMYYADLLLRRAGLERSSRLDHLTGGMVRYLDNPGSARISPERASWTTDFPGSDGDLQADHYLQGEMIASVLDLVLRDRPGGRASLDEVMRRMVRRFPPPGGFTGAELERVAGEVCACDLHGFFQRHVRGAELLDFSAALRTLGWRAQITLQTVVDSAGRPEPDQRVWARVPAGEALPRIVITDPRSVWARAGLHSGDQVRAVNGVPATGMGEIRGAVRTARVGDRVRLEVMRPGGAATVTVLIAPYQRTVVRLADLPHPTPAQLAARARWLAAEP